VGLGASGFDGDSRVNHSLVVVNNDPLIIMIHKSLVVVF